MKTFINTVKTQDLTKLEINQMWNTFSKYYSNTSKEVFERDLSNKSYVFVIKEKRNKSVVGFSTIKEFCVEGIKGRILFSGDTIVEEEYWGRNGLAGEFAKFLVMQKIMSPRTPLYWNLISKGYKTYLTLANNFIDYYPNPSRKTPTQFKEIIDACGFYHYPDKYDVATGVVSFPNNNGEKDKLKNGLCEITEEMLEKSKKIKFFQDVNPQWRRGDELVCIGEFTFDLLLKRAIKLATKSTTKTYAKASYSLKSAFGY